MTAADALTGTTVDLSTPSAGTGGSPHLTAYLVRAAGDEPRPGVVLVHEIFGLDDNARRHAQRIASWGYDVLAPDLFSEGGPLRCLRSTFSALRSGRGRTFADLAAARRWLLDQPDSTGRVGIIGFCMGGGFALLSARPGDGFDVSSTNYGQLPQEPEVLRGACPVVGSFGGRDGSLKGAAAKLDRKLSELGVEHDVVEYPKAGHTFLNDEEGGPWFLRPVLRVNHVRPEPESAAQAWPRIEAFFDAHLRR